MGFFKQKLSDEELGQTVIRPVRLHAGEGKIDLLLGVLELGYTLNDPTVLETNPGSYYSNIRINMAKVTVARVGDEYYQVITDSNNKLHLYLPSTVDEDGAKVWNVTQERT